MRLIDADTIDDVVQDLNENHNSGITRNEYKRITAVLYEMPTIDAVPVKHGEWIKYVDDDPTFDYQKCSVCNEGRPMENFYGLPENYCPNCGAKMDGGEDDV